MRPGPPRTMLVALGLLVLSNGPVFFVTDRVLAGELGWEEPFTRQVFIATALVAVAAVVLDPLRAPGHALTRPSPVAALAVAGFTAWIVATSLWSLAPELTRGRSLVYVGLAAFAWIVADLDHLQFRRAVAWFAGVATALSLAVVAGSESIGLDRNDDWRGVYTNRNSLAPVAGIAIIVGLGFVVESRGRRRAGPAVLVALGAVVMAGSGSRTAWLAVAAAVGVAAVVTAARVARDRRGTKALVAVAGVATAGLAAVGAIVVGLWGEATFEQRRTIWSLVWDRIGDRPVHGHGWFSIWTVPEFTSGDRLLGRGSAHGSFLEVWLGAGLVGTVLFLAIVGLALHGAVRGAWRDPGVATWTWLALVSFLVIENLTESFVLWYSYNWVLLMAAALRSGVGWPTRRAGRTRRAREPVNA